MSYPFVEIVLPSGSENYDLERCGDDSKRLRPLEKVNVFVGSNNSGKSRLLRALAASLKLNVVPNLAMFGLNVSFDSLRDDLRDLKARIQSVLMNNGGRDIDGLEQGIEILTIGTHLSEGDAIIGQLVALLDRMIALPQQKFVYTNDRQAGAATAEFASEALSKLFPNREHGHGIPATKKLYIPTLRSLRAVGGSGSDTFSDRTKMDYFSNAKHVEVFTGLTLYGDIEKLLRGDHSKRETLREFEQWIGEEFFRGESVAIIPGIDSPTLTIKIGNEHERHIEVDPEIRARG